MFFKNLSSKKFQDPTLSGISVAPNS